MADSNQDYDSYEQYIYNRDVYDQIKRDIWDEYYSFPDTILGGETENREFITLDCLRLSKYLNNFYSKENCKKRNCCQYINYLLNKIVRTYYKSNQSIFNIYKAYMNHENNSMIKNLCLTEINYMNQEKYNKIHELYNEYNNCKYYISIKDNIRSCNPAESCANAYNRIMTKYTKPNDTKSCKNLKDLKDYLEQNEPLSTGNCNSRFSNLLLYPPECDELLKEAEKPNAPADQNPGRLDVQKELQNGVTGAAEEEQSERSIGVRSPEIDAPEIVVPGDRRAMEASDPLNHTKLDVGDSNGDTPNNNTKIPVGTILYTSLGSVLPLVTLYRFTPLGSWINTKILRRNKLMENMTKNNYELLLNDAGNHEASLNDPIYHIRYNSATNH